MKLKRPFLNDRLSEDQVGKFKLFADEELIFACREHWLPMILRIVKFSLIGLILAVMTSFFFVIVVQSTNLAISSFILMVLIAGLVVMREFIHWSFHIYIATTKQIIEIHYNPLLSHSVNSVLLDQIRCTEIDVAMYGIIPELIGIGNVELTFDRPTHKEQFVIRGIRSPRAVASLLSAQIHQTLPNVTFSQRQVKNPIWIREIGELKKNKYRFLGDSSYGYNPN